MNRCTSSRKLGRYSVGTYATMAVILFFLIYTVADSFTEIQHEMNSEAALNDLEYEHNVIHNLTKVFDYKLKRNDDVESKDDLYPKIMDGWDNFEQNKNLLKTFSDLEYDDLVRKGIMGGQPADSVTRQRRAYVKSMMRNAWGAYVRDAWGHNMLHPISKAGDDGGEIFGRGQIGATLVDAMDTLFLMEEYGEVLKCRAWLKKHFKANFLKTGSVSVFEITIRFIGGFEAMFALTDDPLYKELAQFVTDQLLVAFTKSNSNINYPFIDIRTQESNRGHISLAEIGTTQLEWAYLSHITGDMIYFNHSIGAMVEVLNDKHLKIPGLYPTTYNVETGTAKSHRSMGIGAGSDSFYEYMLKLWLFTGKSDDFILRKWEESQQAIIQTLAQTSEHGLTFLPDLTYQEGENDHNSYMEHLACFAGGMLALSSVSVKRRHLPENKNSETDHVIETAEGVTKMCYLSYQATESKLGAESFHLKQKLDLVRDSPNEEQLKADVGSIIDGRSFQRPETIESYFYMWRTTCDTKYREWAWQYVQAVEKHYKLKSGGYVGLQDTNNPYGKKIDSMETFFLAETLKYLYLIFSDDTLLPLDRYVLNTEAHPLPILKNGDLPDMLSVA